MWWGGIAENGWGMSVIQHGEKLFAVIYAYDAAGLPTWWVLPDGTWSAKRNAFTGSVYSPRGSPYFAYDASRFVPGAAVGTVTLTFANDRNATLTYTINGVAGTRSITRQVFGVEAFSGYSAGLSEMWWGGVTQNGWGISMVTRGQPACPRLLVRPSAASAGSWGWHSRFFRSPTAHRPRAQKNRRWIGPRRQAHLLGNGWHRSSPRGCRSARSKLGYRPNSTCPCPASRRGSS
jgi:hypothetical protein